MTPDDPRHGTRKGYAAHYTAGSKPCGPCKNAKREADNERRRLMAYGRWQVDMVDADPIREHVVALMAQGMSYKRVAAAARVSTQRMSYLLYGRDGKAPARRVKRDAAEAILAVECAPFKVDAQGARRRLQALAYLGYNQRLLARHIGTTQGMVFEIQNAHPRRLKITAQTHARVDRVYRELCMALPPETNHAERISASVSRNKARSKGWVPPLAWDDIDADKAPHTGQKITPSRDEIDEVVVIRILGGEKLDATKAEREEVVRRWIAMRQPTAELERRLGWKPERYAKRSDAA